MKRARGTTRRLLIVIGNLQDLIGEATHLHGNDRDPMGFEKGQEKLKEAFNLCIDTTGEWPRITEAPHDT